MNKDFFFSYTCNEMNYRYSKGRVTYYDLKLWVEEWNQSKLYLTVAEVVGVGIGAYIRLNNPEN